MDKQEVKCNANLRSNYFSVDVSVLAVVFRRQIQKNRQFCLKVFLKSKCTLQFYVIKNHQATKQSSLNIKIEKSITKIQLHLQSRQKNSTKFRNNCSQVVYQITTLKIFANFSWKHLPWSFVLSNIAGLDKRLLPFYRTLPGDFFCEL